MDLKDGVAIVTGAVGTIGKGNCRELAQEGMHVAVADLSQDGVDSFADEIKA
jgi:NAD(P)-dependent dehydrogenase (short-subunit alcohol dehydrogenase family)